MLTLHNQLFIAPWLQSHSMICVDTLS